ncbi:MAG: hypothetical protein ACREH5_08510 [Candidatus Omnitrophota bacterium]
MNEPLEPRRYFQPLALFLSLFALAAFFNFRVIGKEKEIALIRGEKPHRANFTPFIAKNGKFQQRQSLEILSETPPADGYYSLVYDFRVLKSGAYAVFIAGTPPGAEKPAKGTDWFSPYWMRIDDEPFTQITDERFKKAFPVHPQNTEYVQGGYHWSRIAWSELAKGSHTIEIQVRDRRLRDGKYAFFLDSILFIPKDYKPKRLLKSLDPRFFT